MNAIRLGVCWIGFVGAALSSSGCGGDSGGGGGGSCGISGCGGDIRGTWDVTDMCAQLTGQVNSGVAACDSVAKDALAGAKVVPVNMQVIATDTELTISGNVQAKLHYVYTNDCLTAQGASGASPEQCAAIQSTLMGAGQPGTCTQAGKTCVCDVTQDLPAISDMGTYTVDGTAIITGTERNPYCVKGDTAQVSVTQNGLSGSWTLKKHP
jgi:hypothetical protein